LLYDVFWGLSALAGGMSPAAYALAVSSNIEDHVVVVARRRTCRDGIKVKLVTNLPGNDVV
jgi:hypothetical protein